MSLYSQLKPAWHPDRLVQIREGKGVAPVHVQLILSDLCNQDCGFCAYRMSSGLSSELFALGALASQGHNNPKRMIPAGKALEIVSDCAELGVKAIQFTGGGEPTVHPQHLTVMGQAQKHGIETALVTNGVLMKPLADEIQAMSWIRVSVDAGTETDYVKVRRVPRGHWGRMWANVASLASRYQGTLGIGFVVTPENYEGVREAARLAKGVGAANMRVGAVFSADGLDFYPPGMVHRIADAVAEAKAQTDGDGFELIDLFGRRIGDLEGGRPEHPDCGYQHLTWYIGGDLNLYRCCNVAYSKAGTVTSLKAKRLREVMDGNLHEPFDARGCRFCQFRGQNDAIRALVTEPQHVAFV